MQDSGIIITIGIERVLGFSGWLILEIEKNIKIIAG